MLFGSEMIENSREELDRASLGSHTMSACMHMHAYMFKDDHLYRGGVSSYQTIAIARQWSEQTWLQGLKQLAFLPWLDTIRIPHSDCYQSSGTLFNP